MNLVASRDPPDRLPRGTRKSFCSHDRNERWAKTAAPALAQTAPALVELSFSPSPFDTSAGDALITLTARIVDADGDLNHAGVWLKPGCCQDSQERGFSFNSASRISGDGIDGVYQASFTIPQYSATGDWTVRAFAYDATFLWSEYDSAGLIGLGLPGTLENEAAIGDNSAPQIVELSISPLVVNTTHAPAMVTFTVRMTDDLTGMVSGAVVLQWHHEYGVQGWGVDCMSPSKRISGDALDGIYQCTFAVPQGTLGLFTLGPVYGTDAVGNTEFFLADELEALGLPFRFVNGDCGDGEPDAGEGCDDGNLDDDDGCQSDCTNTGAVCGDGYLHAAEVCDDGNVVDADGCDSNCRPTGCGN